MSKPRLTDLAANLPSAVPFVGPEAQERASGRKFKARLGANESVFGPSPLAIKAMEAAASQVWMYGDPEIHDLRHALADHHGIPPENIIIGEGIDGLQGYLLRLMVGKGDVVVTSNGAYPTFNFHAEGFGGILHKVPYKGDFEDPSALLTAARDKRAKLIYFANPDNPMGAWHSADQVQKMIDNVPDGCLLVLDEAYIEMAPAGTAPDIDVNCPNVIRMRTFSKAYGMAGLRVGYAIGPADLISAFDKVRNHFGVGRIAQAGALAALRDQSYLAQAQSEIAASRDEITRIAQENGLKALPSATNFVAVDCGRDGDFAMSVLSHLIEQGIFVRMPAVAPLNRCIRVSCGSNAEMQALATALPIALAQAAL